jgi:zinc protease
VQVFRAANEIPILVRKRSSPIIYLEIQVSGGSSLETIESAGITNLAVRTTVKGAGKYSAEQIAAIAEGMGGSIGVGVGRDSTAWTLSVPTHHFEKAVSLLADVAMHATLADDAIETERNAVLSSLAQLRDDMYSYPVRLATLSAFAGPPYGIPVSGIETSVSAVSPEELRGWYENVIKRGEWTVGVVGDIDPQSAADTVARAMQAASQGTRHILQPVDWPNDAQSVVETRDKAQTALALAFPGARRNDSDRYVAAMIATVASGLGGRFFEQLRDKQSLAYTVHAFSATHPAGGLFLSYIATSPEKEGLARDGLLAQFEELKKFPVSEDELERAKQYAIGTHAIEQESGSAVLTNMISAFTVGRGLEELAEFESSILAVTPERMLDFARRNFDPARRVEGIIRGVGRTV